MANPYVDPYKEFGKMQMDHAYNQTIDDLGLEENLDEGSKEADYWWGWADALHGEEYLPDNDERWYRMGWLDCTAHYWDKNE